MGPALRRPYPLNVCAAENPTWFALSRLVEDGLPVGWVLFSFRMRAQRVVAHTARKPEQLPPLRALYEKECVHRARGSFGTRLKHTAPHA